MSYQRKIRECCKCRGVLVIHVCLGDPDKICVRCLVLMHLLWFCRSTCSTCCICKSLHCLISFQMCSFCFPCISPTIIYARGCILPYARIPDIRLQTLPIQDPSSDASVNTSFDLLHVLYMQISNLIGFVVKMHCLFIYFLSIFVNGHNKYLQREKNSLSQQLYILHLVWGQWTSSYIN